MSEVEMNNINKSSQDALAEKPNNSFPKSIPFIIGNEFCERFCYYGLRAILTLYFVNVLKYKEDQAIEAFHLFAMFCYFTPLLGAFIADSYLGKYLTILYLSIVYVIGNIFISYASYAQSEILTIAGLALVALGTGGIKPCVSAFGGDQFKENQTHLIEKFFSLFYLSINLGSLVSMFVTPVFRKDITCFGHSSCYPLAFGVPALLMIIALLLFLIGTPLYVRKPSAKGNVVVEFLSCVIYSLYKKITNICSSDAPPHFLDYSASKYESSLIEDSKSVLSCFLLLIPIPIFWSLFDQQGSKWVLQAENLNGEVSFLKWNYTLTADQFQVINPLMIVFMIPLFDYLIYPVFKKIGFCTKPLQRMGFGGLVAALAFVCAGLLELHIESAKINPPSLNETNLNLIFLNEAKIERVDLLSESGTLTRQNDFDNRFIDFNTIPFNNYTLNAYLAKNKNYTKKLSNLRAGHVYTVLIYENNGQLDYKLDENNTLQADYGKFQLKIYLNQENYLNQNNKSIENIIIKSRIGNQSIPVDGLIFSSPHMTLHEISDGYDIYFDQKFVYTLKGSAAKSYKLIILAKENDEHDIERYEWINFKQVSMLWQFVQYIVITASEIMFSITGLTFCYSEAPESMKSVVSAAWLFTTAMGNLFVVIITSLVKFESQAVSFFFYGFLMALDIFLFIVLAYFYKPRNDNGEDEKLELKNCGSNGTKKD